MLKSVHHFPPFPYSVLSAKCSVFPSNLQMSTLNILKVNTFFFFGRLVVVVVLSMIFISFANYRLVCHDGTVEIKLKYTQCYLTA